MSSFNELRHVAFQSLFNGAVKSLYQSNMLTCCSLPPPVVLRKQRLVTFGTRRYFTVNSHCKLDLHNHAARHFRGLDFRISSPMFYNKIKFSSDEALMKGSAAQLSDQAKSLIALCKDGFREGKPNARCTVIESTPATNVTTALLRDLNHDDIIVEINPGPGFLTQQLLERTKNRLIIFEPRKFFYERLRSAFHSEVDSGRLVVSAHSFYDFYSIYLRRQKEHLDDPVLRLLGIVPVESQLDRVKIKVLGGVTARKFFSRLHLCTTLGISIMARCDPVFYLYTTDELKKKFFTSFELVDLRKNYKHSFLSNFVLKVDQIGVENVSCFYPILKPNLSMPKLDYSVYHLLRVEPNWTFLNKFCRSEAELFMYYIQLLSQQSRQKALIDMLEMWVPGVAIPLIDGSIKGIKFSNFLMDMRIAAKKEGEMQKLTGHRFDSVGITLADDVAGFNVYTFASQLTKEEILFIYQVFRKHPNFSDSTFPRTAKAWIGHLTNLKEHED